MTELADMADQLSKSAAGIPKLEKELRSCAAALRLGEHGMFLNRARTTAESILKAALKKAGTEVPPAQLQSLIEHSGKLQLLPKNVRNHVETIQKHGNYGSHGQSDLLDHASPDSDEDLKYDADATLTGLKVLVSWFVVKHGPTALSAPEPGPPAVPVDHVASAAQGGGKAATPLPPAAMAVAVPKDLLSVADLARALVKKLGESAASLVRQALGRTTGGSLSPQMMNEVLKEIGLQDKADGVWTLTEQGRALGFETSHTDWRGETIRHVRWKPETEEVLERELLRRIGVAPAPGSDGANDVSGQEARDDWLSATQIGESLREELSVGGCNLLRAELGRKGETGSVSPQMVNELLEQMGFVVTVGEQRRLTELGAQYGQERGALGRPEVRILQWDPSTVGEVARHARKLLGTKELKAAAAESAFNFSSVGELSGAKALSYDLIWFISDVTGNAESLVKRQLRKFSMKKVKTIFDFYNPDFLAKVTVRRALDYDMSEAIAAHVRLDEGAVRGRLKKVESGNTRVATVFAKEW